MKITRWDIAKKIINFSSFTLKSDDKFFFIDIDTAQPYIHVQRKGRRLIAPLSFEPRYMINEYIPNIRAVMNT